MLFFAALEDETISTERRARLMGTVVGMADFARCVRAVVADVGGVELIRREGRMLNPGDAPAVRSVHSQKQRMVWLEPE